MESMKELEAMLEASFRPVKKGDLVTGTVLQAARRWRSGGYRQLYGRFRPLRPVIIRRRSAKAVPPPEAALRYWLPR